MNPDDVARAVEAAVAWRARNTLEHATEARFITLTDEGGLQQLTDALLEVAPISAGARCPRCHHAAPNVNGCARCNPERLGDRLTKTLGTVKDLREALAEAIVHLGDCARVMKSLGLAGTAVGVELDADLLAGTMEILSDETAAAKARIEAAKKRDGEEIVF